MDSLQKYLVYAHDALRPRRHFVVFRDVPIGYGRIPKAANSSVKRALGRYLSNPPSSRVGVSPDSFWQTQTAGETRMATAEEMLATPGVFAFTVVRHPLGRLASYYADKVCSSAILPDRAMWDGVAKHMPFEEFVERLPGMREAHMDAHLMPQASILAHDGRLAVGFVARVETLNRDWRRLRSELQERGIADIGGLPLRNLNAPRGHDVKRLFANPTTLRIARDRYAADFQLFYPDE